MDFNSFAHFITNPTFQSELMQIYFPVLIFLCRFFVFVFVYSLILNLICPLIYNIIRKRDFIIVSPLFLSSTFKLYYSAEKINARVERSFFFFGQYKKKTGFPRQ